MTKENTKKHENCECHIDECTCELDAQNQNAPQSDEPDWKDQALRALAEIQNIKHRSQIEIERNSKALLKDFARDIISILDSYDYAFASLEKLPQTAELKSTIDGFQTIYQNFLTVLGKHNITKIQTNISFDPNFHNAIMFQSGENGKILNTAENGYRIGDEVLRPSSVIVGKE